MAWRIHDSVQRGEVDNRERGVVRGKVWLRGVAEPVVLDLKGNACADLAGCLLTFENPGEPFPMRADARLNPVQRGTIGDLTASRKVRVLEMPIAEAYLRKKKGLPVPEHMANSLYLEWFSEANGRVVIESADYKLTISPPVWKLSADEEEQRRKSAAEGFAGFMGKLSETIESLTHEPEKDKEWNEFDYEKFLRETDARTDKYGELMDKYRDHPDRDRLVAKEMGWTWLEEALDEEDRQRERKNAGTDEPSEEEAEDDDPFGETADDLPSLEPDPATEGVDWVRDGDDDISHPLSLRVFNSSIALWQKCQELKLSESGDDDLDALLSEYQITSAKLAGALDGLAYGRDTTSGAFVVASLKRALNHLHAAQAALERVSSKNLLPAPIVSTTRAEFFSVREEILRLMTTFRGISSESGD
jgi:hypothetical protein